MKTEEIKIRVSTTLKQDFQEICENEQTTMSNKINNYIFEEIKVKKKKDLIGQIMTKKLLKFGVVSTNGRIYTKNELIRVKLNDVVLLPILMYRIAAKRSYVTRNPVIFQPIWYEYITRNGQV
jgi:hypothetical protein